MLSNWEKYLANLEVSDAKRELGIYRSSYGFPGQIELDPVKPIPCSDDGHRWISVIASPLDDESGVMFQIVTGEGVAFGLPDVAVRWSDDSEDVNQALWRVAVRRRLALIDQAVSLYRSGIEPTDHAEFMAAVDASFEAAKSEPVVAVPACFVPAGNAS